MLAEQPAGGLERRESDQQVDEEDRAPALPVHEQAADGGPGCGCDRARRAPERRCRRAALERKLGEQQTERRRHEHGAPEGLYGASTDEHADRARRPAGDGGAEEDDDADEEEAPSAEANSGKTSLSLVAQISTS